MFGEDPATRLWAVSSVAAFLLAALSYFFLFGQRSKKKYKYPLPPRSGYGFLETFQNFNSTKLHEWTLEVARTRGRIVEMNLWPLLPRDTLYAVTDPVVARKILENPQSVKPRELYSFFDGMMGGVCFISEEGERYKHPRKSTLMGISHANMDDMLANMHAVMDKWIQGNLGSKKGEVACVDIGFEMQKATIHSIGLIAFGYDFSTAEQEFTSNALAKITYEFGIASEKNPLRKHPIIGLLWADKREAIRCVEDVRCLVRKVLQAHRSKSLEEQKKVVTLNSLDAPGKYDAIGGEESLLSDMILLYAAGFDTTGYTISYALVELCKNKDIQTQLRKELLDATQDPKDKKLIGSPLLKRVVKETLRLWPVAAGGGVRIVPDKMIVTSDDGKGGKRLMTLPKGSWAHVAPYPLLRDDEVFDRPDEWLPSRWENATDDMKTAFMPFMVGRRSCPGQLLAMSESEVFLARLVRDYEWTLIEETIPEWSVTLKIKGTILQATKIG
ncbi:cytochrome P450 [Nitzschia inconspicua]|uniref:Cytochrome P450 n=1 Tax=Nitzschia inconspicua TaxID=303405 RepID=A0A9K3L7Y8_9STRA|nr:cytochrome P450 [Nitzschia inconspicua]KAG7357410.1 cytochrome P450 [Nitzschia inconspicua]